MDETERLFDRLSKSKFRSSFKLKKREFEYLSSKGIDTIMDHALDFISARICPSEPPNDGKQTPYRNHPVFVAQHATATCCRGCIEKWHGIKKGTELKSGERDYILGVIRKWLELQLEKS